MESKLQALVKLWTDLNSSQRVMVTFFGATIVVLAIVLGTVATRPEYTVLFSNLRPEDAASISQKLRDTKVPYRITGNGTAIEVPANSVHQVRLDLAGQGLPEGGGVGFEIFDRGSLGVTDFSQRMSFQRALQGELQRTISSLNGVQDARVHIVMPDDTLYISREKEASASVLLNLNSAGNLPREQVQSIVNLVSASVEGLKPERVTVVDTRGNMLADGSGADTTGLKMSSTQLDIKREVERNIQHNVESMLDQVAGPGKSVVRVNARLSFDTRETTSELYEPIGGSDEGIIARQERTREVYDQGARGIGGIPGTASNVDPAAPPQAGAAGRGGYEREQESTQYHISKRLERMEQAPGRVEQVNVAVMVDREVGEEKVASLRQAVAAAAGTDPARGDRVVVETVEFPQAPAEEAPPMMAAVGKYASIGRNALAILLLAAFAFFLKGALTRQPIGIPQQEPLALAASRGGEIGEEKEEALPPAKPKVLQKKKSPELEMPLASAQDIAKQQPEEIANVVRSWMQEGKKAA